MKRHLSLLFTLLLVLSLAIVAGPLAMPVEAQPGTTWYVATTGSDAFGDGTQTWVDVDTSGGWTTGDTGPWLTIQTAHNDAGVGNGDTINVAAGTYTENVTVNKQLTIEGAGAGTTTVNPSNTVQPVFNVTADGTAITGFTISGATGSAGVSLNTAQVQIRDNTISGNALGILLSTTTEQCRINRNTITTNIVGVRIGGGQGWNDISYNDISGNTNYGVFAYPVPGMPYWKKPTDFNYWGHASGPGGDGPGTGDAVNENVWFNPWLNTGYATILASGIADISIGIRLKVGWNTLSTPLPLDGDNTTPGPNPNNQWRQIVLNSGLQYTLAYTYDPTTGWSSPIATTDAMVLQPLNAMFIQMSSANITNQNVVTFKVSTAVNTPPTKTLAADWNIIGAAMAINERELEMWKVLISVANTSDGLVGYNMVVSPPLATQPPWVYVRGQETAEAEGWEWQKMDFGRAYWIYMENGDEMAGFASTPITARIWE